MNRFNFGFGAVLATVVLLAYTYISFLGMLYKVDGVIWKAILFAVAVIAIVAICVYIMVNAKMTKSKEIGVVGQIIFGLIILGAFVFSGGPFTSFLKVLENKNDIEKEISSVRQLAAGLDSNYNTYVYNRVQQYENRLSSGNELTVQSLQRRLAPEKLDSVQTLRQQWVAQIGDMSIWNIMLPQNLHYMQECVKDWTENYNDISSFAYDGELMEPFKYPVFDSKLDDLLNSFKNAGYSIWAILAAIIAALAMLVPYWLAIPPKTRKTTTITYVNKKNTQENE